MYVSTINDGVLFSSSADRTIRVWDITRPVEKACVQVIHGHGIILIINRWYNK